MNEDYMKLVAKIQHFYDLMIIRLDEMETGSVTCIDSDIRMMYKEKSCELNYLVYEYEKTFMPFLFKEGD